MAWQAPKGKAKRSKMKARCGPSCFLDPGRLAYPVCTPACKPSCDGLLAAFTAARGGRGAAPRPDLAAKAVRKAKRAGCPWARRH